jgi:hypothetical protein
MKPYSAFVCNKAVYGSSMWHFRWGVPSRMTGERGSPLKGGKFEIDRDGLKGAENFSVHSGT